MSALTRVVNESLVVQLFTSSVNNFVELSHRIDVENTRLAYVADVEQYRVWLDGDDVSPSSLRDWLQSVADSGLTSATINRKRASVLWLVEQVYERSLETVSTTYEEQAVVAEVQKRCASFKYVKTPKGKVNKRAVNWLSKRQVATILKHVSHNAETRMAVALMAGAGLRISEALSLTADSFVHNGEFMVIQLVGKGSKQREVPVSDWLADNLTLPASGRLFSINRRAMARRLGRASEALGIKFKPHDFRSSFARLSYKAGNDVLPIANVMGHSSTRTTRGYIGADLDAAKSAVNFGF